MSEGATPAEQGEAAMADDVSTAPDPPATETAEPAGEVTLGDAGKKALDAERSERRKAERRAKELDAELAKLREASMTEQEKAVEAARQEAIAETTKAYNRRILEAELRALASGKLADPDDALRYLSLDDYEVTDEGVDRKALTRDIETLVKSRPYLAAGATRPAGDADLGARGAAMALNGDPLLDALKAKLGIT